MSFKDHFSGHADRYEAFRPTYPEALFAYLASIAPGHELAWDCATGNGQAAVGLAAHFQSVVASDSSRKQLEQARRHDRIRYVAAHAERTPLPAASVDVMTVAQAVHWFDLPRFYAEVGRVCRPGGVCAVWCYGLHTVDPGVDAVIHHFYGDVVGEFWPPERHFVEERYTTLGFPFGAVPAPAFAMESDWDLSRVLGYLNTWSAAQRYRARHGADPIEQVRSDLEAAWGDPAGVRRVSWPLSLLVGRVGP
jgi:SAM-dependent methyltransferase